MSFPLSEEFQFPVVVSPFSVLLHDGSAEPADQRIRSRSETERESRSSRQSAAAPILKLRNFLRQDSDFSPSKLAEAAGKMGRGAKKGKNLNELKQELEIDVHKVDVDVLCKRFNTTVENGLTDELVEAGNKEHGPNALTPPPTVPEWVKFCKCLFSGFAMLLWLGAILCFVAYGIQVIGRTRTKYHQNCQTKYHFRNVINIRINQASLQASAYEEPPDDNLYLGIVLSAVVTVTGIFSYYQVNRIIIVFASRITT